MTRPGTAVSCNTVLAWPAPEAVAYLSLPRPVAVDQADVGRRVQARQPCVALNADVVAVRPRVARPAGLQRHLGCLRPRPLALPSRRSRACSASFCGKNP